MEIKTKQKGESIFLSLKGRLDANTSPKLQEVLTEAFTTAETVELDFAKIEYVSSAGLRILLIGEKKARAAEKTLALKNVSSDIMEIFEITGFSGILHIR